MRESLFEYPFWIRSVPIIHFLHPGNLPSASLTTRYSMTMCSGETVLIFCVDVTIAFTWNIFNFLDTEVQHNNRSDWATIRKCSPHIHKKTTESGSHITYVRHIQILIHDQNSLKQHLRLDCMWKDFHMLHIVSKYCLSRKLFLISIARMQTISVMRYVIHIAQVPQFLTGDFEPLHLTCEKYNILLHDIFCFWWYVYLAYILTC